MDKEEEMANPLTIITNLKSWKSGKNALHQGVVKRDWVPTGRIDFATKLNSNDDPHQPNEFKLLVEERRIIESVAGNEHLEIQWRLATLKEAKAVVTQYHKYLKENSLVKSVSDPEILPPESQDSGVPSEVATAAPQSLAHMKFFLPVQETKIAEESYQAIKKFIEKQTGWPISDGRYYEIHYRQNDRDLCARVGGPDPLNGEKVFAIFKPKNPISPFLVCTYSRGVVQGQPILASHDAQAVEFEPESKLH
jgi:hypothetical protein